MILTSLNKDGKEKKNFFPKVHFMIKAQICWMKELVVVANNNK